MKTYKVAAMVRHSGKHLQIEFAGYDLKDAFAAFDKWLYEQGLHIDAISELDITELSED